MLRPRTPNETALLSTVGPECVSLDSACLWACANEYRRVQKGRRYGRWYGWALKFAGFYGVGIVRRPNTWPMVVEGWDEMCAKVGLLLSCRVLREHCFFDCWIAKGQKTISINQNGHADVSFMTTLVPTMVPSIESNCLIDSNKMGDP